MGISINSRIHFNTYRIYAYPYAWKKKGGGGGGDGKESLCSAMTSFVILFEGDCIALEFSWTRSESGLTVHVLWTLAKFGRLVLYATG